MTDDPFQYMNAIVKHNYMEVGDDYNPYLVNRFFSYFIDTVLVAEFASRFGNGVDKQLHFDFYYSQVQKRWRTAKWYKPKNTEDIQAICKYYDVSEREARLYARALSDEMKEEIRKKVNEIP